MRHWTRSIILCSYYIPIMELKSTLIPTLDNFKANPYSLDTDVQNDIIKFKKANPNNTDSVLVVTKLSEIIGYLQAECARSKNDTLSLGYRTVCNSRLTNYNNFLKNYQNGKLVGGRRKTLKGRRKQKNKSRRNRKSRR